MPLWCWTQTWLADKGCMGAESGRDGGTSAGAWSFPS